MQFVCFWVLLTSILIALAKSETACQTCDQIDITMESLSSIFRGLEPITFQDLEYCQTLTLNGTSNIVPKKGSCVIPGLPPTSSKLKSKFFIPGLQVECTVVNATALIKSLFAKAGLPPPTLFPHKLPTIVTSFFTPTPTTTPVTESPLVFYQSGDFQFEFQANINFNDGGSSLLGRVAKKATGLQVTRSLFARETQNAIRRLLEQVFIQDKLVGKMNCEN